MTIENFLEKFRHLPASEIAVSVNNALNENGSLIVTAPPGAGKSTLLPLTMMKGVNGSGKILMLEPRRLAARQIAERMAMMLGEKVGESVGYRVRFENRISKSTQIEVITEGILTRMLIDDSTLDGVNIVIFDEFHERSLNSDLAFALTLHARNIIRPDLKIVIMSATIDTENICQALHAPLIKSDGKLFPIETFYEKADTDFREIHRKAASVISVAHREHEGDILAFLPGQGDILKCKELLETALLPTKIHTLYGNMPQNEQDLAIAPSPKGERKVVLATPIAETSLTIEGVRIVVDSGLYRTLKFDANSELSHLETQRISMDMATQRKGRAGRLSSGVCYRLWSKGTELNMKEQRTPEISEADLTSLLLEVAAFGENDIYSLPWLTPPPKESIVKAKSLLTILGALDTHGNITALGRRMSYLPCHPRIARMILSAPTPQMKSLACDIAAVMEEKDPLPDPAGTDFSLRISLLRKTRGSNNHDRWKRIIKISSEYQKLSHTKEDNTDIAPEEVGELIAYAYPERIAMAANGIGEYNLANGSTALIDHADTMSSYTWIAIASMYAKAGSKGRVFLAAPLTPNSLDKSVVTTHDNISWDSRCGSVIKCREKRIGRLIIESKPIHNVDSDEIIYIICEAAKKDGRSMFSWDDDVHSLQQRVAKVASWHPELNVPDLSTETILNTASEWLPYYINRDGHTMSTVEELRKLNLKEILWNTIPYDLQEKIDRIAPTHIKMPTGSNIRIDYRKEEEPPMLSVRLQECFGMQQTPYINDGKCPVLMQLLSPGFKPVQITQDLQSFWQDTYFEVRKELRRRYPKHFWPDNPSESIPVRGVKRPKSKE